MGVFRQFGDPVCPDCLCQHHEEAYAEFETIANAAARDTYYDVIANDAVIVSVQITITETCCVVVNAATILHETNSATDLEIERPLTATRTQQEAEVLAGAIKMTHHAAWEVLTPGVYTYYLVNRSGGTVAVHGSWIKAVASDCLG